MAFVGPHICIAFFGFSSELMPPSTFYNHRNMKDVDLEKMATTKPKKSRNAPVLSASASGSRQKSDVSFHVTLTSVVFCIQCVHARFPSMHRILYINHPSTLCIMEPTWKLEPLPTPTIGAFGVCESRTNTRCLARSISQMRHGVRHPPIHEKIDRC